MTKCYDSHYVGDAEQPRQDDEVETRGERGEGGGEGDEDQGVPDHPFA